MSGKNDNGGVHYHYHFYGNQHVPPQDSGQPPMSQAQQWPGQPPFPGQPWPGVVNPHPHPQADSLIKGLAVGAGAAWLLTSEPAQRVIMRTAVQLWATVQGGIEELKERYHDAEAEAAGDAVYATPTTDGVAEPQPEPEPMRHSGPRSVKD